MRTVTLEVSSRKDTTRRFLRAFEGEPQGEFISFETPALLFKDADAEAVGASRGADGRRAGDAARGRPPGRA